MKILLFIIIAFAGLGCRGQNKTDLSEVRFDENMDAFVKDIPNVLKRNLFDRTDMSSYAVRQNSVYTFREFVPAAVELLSYKGGLAGFAFKMKTFADQQKVEGYLRAKYKLTFSGKMTDVVSSWKYGDENVSVELRSIPSNAFVDGTAGYLTVFRTDFAADFDRMMAK